MKNIIAILEIISGLQRFIVTAFSAGITSVIGYTMHGSVFWMVVDFCFAPLVWVKWVWCHEMTLSVIRETFPWFFS